MNESDNRELSGSPLFTVDELKALSDVELRLMGASIGINCMRALQTLCEQRYRSAVRSEIYQLFTLGSHDRLWWQALENCGMGGDRESVNQQATHILYLYLLGNKEEPQMDRVIEPRGGTYQEGIQDFDIKDPGNIVFYLLYSPEARARHLYGLLSSAMVRLKTKYKSELGTLETCVESGRTFVLSTLNEFVHSGWFTQQNWPPPFLPDPPPEADPASLGLKILTRAYPHIFTLKGNHLVELSLHVFAAMLLDSKRPIDEDLRSKLEEKKEVKTFLSDFNSDLSGFFQSLSDEKQALAIALDTLLKEPNFHEASCFKDILKEHSTIRRLSSTGIPGMKGINDAKREILQALLRKEKVRIHRNRLILEQFLPGLQDSSQKFKTWIRKMTSYANRNQQHRVNREYTRLRGMGNLQNIVPPAPAATSPFYFQLAERILDPISFRILELSFIEEYGDQEIADILNLEQNEQPADPDAEVQRWTRTRVNKKKQAALDTLISFLVSTGDYQISDRQSLPEYVPFLSLDVVRRQQEKIYIVSGISMEGRRDLYMRFAGKNLDMLFENLQIRGVKKVCFFISDDEPGLKAALHQYFPNAHYQYSQKHLERAVLQRTPRNYRVSMEDLLREVLGTDDARTSHATFSRSRLGGVHEISAALDLLASSLADALAVLALPLPRRNTWFHSTLFHDLDGHLRFKPEDGTDAVLRKIDIVIAPTWRRWQAGPLIEMPAMQPDCSP